MDTSKRATVCQCCSVTLGRPRTQDQDDRKQAYAQRPWAKSNANKEDGSTSIHIYPAKNTDKRLADQTSLRPTDSNCNPDDDFTDSYSYSYSYSASDCQGEEAEWNPEPTPEGEEADDDDDFNKCDPASGYQGEDAEEKGSQEPAPESEEINGTREVREMGLRPDILDPNARINWLDAPLEISSAQETTKEAILGFSKKYAFALYEEFVHLHSWKLGLRNPCSQLLMLSTSRPGILTAQEWIVSGKSIGQNLPTSSECCF
ncbi:hypothetical protein V8C35DRAFT_150758 [Trichoderma chlorosporum]